MKRLIATLLPLLLCQSAQAQTIVSEDEYESNRYFMVEFKLGPYSPDIDDSLPSGASAFEHIFGSGTGLMIKGEGDVELWNGFGTVAVGGEIGYYSADATALRDNGSDTTPSTSSELTGSSTSISLLPLSLLAIYRFDWPVVRYKIPVVPFVKFGVNYTIWWIKIDDDLARYQDDKARGGTFGWQLNVGGALLLDIIEPSAAKTLDVELGINHTYLFFEFTKVGSLGSSKLNVGDTTWNAGIAFEF